MKKNSIISAIVLMSLFSGCQKDNIHNTDTGGQEFHIVTNVVSRSAVFAENFKLLVDQEGVDMDYNVIMKNEEGVWKAYSDDNKNVRMKWKDALPVPVTAVYMQGNDDMVLDNEISDAIPNDQSASEFNINDYDVLYYNNIISDKETTLLIDFSHLLSEIQVTSTPEGLPNGVTISSMRISSLKTSYSWIPVQGLETFKVTGNPVDVTLKADEGMFKCILPSQYIDGAELKVIYSDGTEQNQKFNSTTLASGVSYDVTNFKYNPGVGTEGLARSLDNTLYLNIIK